MADIHSNHKVWLECPALECPSPQKGKRGRPATKPKLNPDVDRFSLHQRVDRICQDNFDKYCEQISFRQGSKGALTGRFHLRTVWLWDEHGNDPPRERRLLISPLTLTFTHFPLPKIPL